LTMVENADNNSEIDIEAVYRQYALPLKKFIVSMCSDSDMADDIVSETFFRAIKNIDSFYGGNIFTWLCTIAKNIFFNLMKKKETQNVSLDAEEQAEPVSPKKTEDMVIQKMNSLELLKNMQSLGYEEREVIYLRIFADLSFGDIGEVLGKTENWARVTFFRSKDKLKRRMNNE